jgi:hypothetical protein
MELILIPLSLEGQLACLVVETPVTIHHVVLPTPVVITTVTVVEYSGAVALTV